MDVELNGAGFITEDSTLWIHRLPVRVASASSASTVEIPAAFTTWSLSDDSKLRDVAPYFLSIRYDDNAIFRFAPLDEFRAMQVQRLRLTMRVNDASILLNGKLSLWNLETKGWEEIQMRGRQSIVVEDAKRFMSQGNHVQVRLEPSLTGQGFIFYDAVEVSLIGQLR
jgi:hypothetical protein